MLSVGSSLAPCLAVFRRDDRGRVRQARAGCVDFAEAKARRWILSSDQQSDRRGVLKSCDFVGVCGGQY